MLSVHSFEYGFGDSNGHLVLKAFHDNANCWKEINRRQSLLNELLALTKPLSYSML